MQSIIVQFGKQLIKAVIKIIAKYHKIFSVSALNPNISNMNSKWQQLTVTTKTQTTSRIYEVYFAHSDLKLAQQL